MIAQIFKSLRRVGGKKVYAYDSICYWDREFSWVDAQSYEFYTVLIVVQ